MIVSLADAVARLARGELVAYPTETVYGLGAVAASAVARERLLALKGRDAHKGLAVLVADLAALRRAAQSLPGAAVRLALRFWPGPLTLVVPATAPELAAVATEFGVGFRCSPQPTAAALARAAPEAVVSTSCNRSGDAPCRDAAEVAACFGADFPVLGGEPASGLAPSTVVAVTADGRLELLREGSIAWSEIRASAR
jgi:L-threonylcarbamoyladenylate synthase